MKKNNFSRGLYLIPILVVAAVVSSCTRDSSTTQQSNSGESGTIDIDTLGDMLRDGELSVISDVIKLAGQPYVHFEEKEPPHDTQYLFDIGSKRILVIYAQPDKGTITGHRIVTSY